MSLTFTENVTLVKEECITCGCAFAMPQTLRNQLLADHRRSMYCPNGHPQNYTGETEAQRLARELAVQKAETIRQRDNYFSEQRRHEDTSKKLKNLKKRTAAGVCPCCKRTFNQLSRHMQGKHPEFVKENGITAAAGGNRQEPQK